MKLIVTGANGFVGAALCRYFYSQGFEVIATGRQETPDNNLLAYATYIPYDITKPIDTFHADVCIHAAGLASDTAAYDDLFLNNVTGTRNVLEAAKNCRYFVFISSSSVYDFTHKPAVETDADLNAAISNYGRTKLMAEELVTTNIPQHQQRLVLRPRAIYGIGDRILLPRLLSLVKGKTIFYPASRALQTSATQVINIAYAIELFFNQQNIPPAQVFNIADDVIYSLKEMTVKMLNAVEQRRLKVIDIPVELIKLLSLVNYKKISPLVLKTLTQNSVLNTDAIKQALGYQPANNFDNSFAAISNWVHDIGGKKLYISNLQRAPWLHV
jgi:nucleoside-diphosphate-sugar epimerase